METAHRQCQYKNIKKPWYTLQLQRNSKTTFIKTVVFFFYSLSYHMNYANITWARSYKSKLEGLYCHQKHAARIINFKDKFTLAQPLLHDMKSLNIFQIN